MSAGCPASHFVHLFYFILFIYSFGFGAGFPYATPSAPGNWTALSCISMDGKTARRGYLENRISGQLMGVFGTGFFIGCAHGIFIDAGNKTTMQGEYRKLFSFMSIF